jgi:hypothetical protein
VSVTLANGVTAAKPEDIPVAPRADEVMQGDHGGASREHRRAKTNRLDTELLKRASCPTGRLLTAKDARHHCRRDDCVAGVVGLELRNPGASHVFEMT